MSSPLFIRLGLSPILPLYLSSLRCFIQNAQKVFTCFKIGRSKEATVGLKAGRAADPDGPDAVLADVVAGVRRQTFPLT
jgi:hypothetical protein